MARLTDRWPGPIAQGAGAALVLLLAALVGPAAVAQSAAQPAGASAPAQPARSATATQPSGSQPPAATGKTGPATAAPPASPPGQKGAPVRNLPARFAGRAGMYYKVVWGVDSLTVKSTEMGEVIRFSWRVLDPQLAKVLNDKKIEPSLIDPQAGVSLVVPVMEKIGQLRQVQPPEAGRSYWMAFSNKGRLVKRGDRVDVVVGPFHAQGLVVD